MYMHNDEFLFYVKVACVTLRLNKLIPVQQF